MAFGYLLIYSIADLIIESPNMFSIRGNKDTKQRWLLVYYQFWQMHMSPNS